LQQLQPEKNADINIATAYVISEESQSLALSTFS